MTTTEKQFFCCSKTHDFDTNMGLEVRMQHSASSAKDGPESESIMTARCKRYGS